MHLSLQASLLEEKGFAAGKLGYSEQAWLKFPKLYESSESPLARIALSTWIYAHAYRQSGVFPGTPQFILEFCKKFIDCVEEADYLALASGWENTIMHEGIDESKVLDFWALEPDRSTPYNQENCYLHLLKNKKILIINSIGDFLQERANKETFEAVWANVGRPWFEPANVTAVTFPFVYDEKVQSQFGNVWNIYDLILNQLDKLEYEVALIGAGCLGIPIATHIKRQGKVGISLGAHLQVLFGVYGNRWWRDEDWKTRYFNDSWVRSPESKMPTNRSGLPDDASYW